MKTFPPATPNIDRVVVVDRTCTLLYLYLLLKLGQQVSFSICGVYAMPRPPCVDTAAAHSICIIHKSKLFHLPHFNCTQNPLQNHCRQNPESPPGSSALLHRLTSCSSFFLSLLSSLLLRLPFSFNFPPSSSPFLRPSSQCQLSLGFSFSGRAFLRRHLDRERERKAG